MMGRTHRHVQGGTTVATEIIESEIAGTVWKIEIAPGATVEEDDVLVILESMKMEIPVLAPGDGTVVAILVAEGDAVAEGQPLVSLTADV